MSKFLVKKDTCISHLSRLAKVGEVVEFDIPLIKVFKKDPITGRPVPGEDGSPAFDEVPMTIGENLELIKPPVAPKKPEIK